MGDDVWLLDEEDPYARLRLIAWWNQERLASARLLVVGAGALGNEVLKNLALLGVGHVHVVDFDTIENSNLSRSVLFRGRDRGRSKAEVAVEAVRDIHPGVCARASNANVLTDIGLGEFLLADVVIGCLDNREARLWVNRSCWKTGTPWVDGGIQEINGVVKTFVPPQSACYECAMTKNDYRLLNLRYSCPLLRQEDLLAGKVPTAPTIASIIAGMQTQEALKLLHGMPVASGEAMVFNGVANQFYRTRFQRREDCLSHDVYPPPLSMPWRASQITAGQALAEAAGYFQGDEILALELDRDLVVSIDCELCGQQRPVMRVAPLVGAREAHCLQCGETARPRMIHSIEQDDSWRDRTLAELGVPAFDILRISSRSGEARAFLLQGDQPPELTSAPDLGAEA